jgi:hypothetical protein
MPFAISRPVFPWPGGGRFIVMEDGMLEIDANGIAVKLPLDALRGIIREVVAELLSSVGTDDRLSYTEAEAAKLIGVPRHSLREARVLGRVSPVKVGKRYLYSRAMLSRMVGGD